MVIYADVLILLNTLVDYFLIKLTVKLSNCEVSFWRLLFSSVLGGLLSLYIFLPYKGFLIEASIRLSMSLILTITVFGFRSIKAYIRNSLYLFAVTYLFGGIMFAIWLLFKPNNMVINNSIVYFNISPVVLIISSAVYYLAVMLLRFFFKKNASFSENCKVNIILGDNNKTINGIIDTGNSITDVFGVSEIIITSKAIAENIIKNESETEKSRRYRKIPVKTILGTRLLDGYRIDKAKITTNGETKTLKSPILAVSNVNLDSEWDAIINPRSLL